MQLTAMNNSNKKSNEENSHWNFSKVFSIEMSFTISDISSMLEQYDRINNTGMDIQNISKYIYEYSSGHPFLTSVICKIIDEELFDDELIKKWSILGVKKSINFILNSKITFFSDIIDKITENSNLKKIIKKTIFHNQIFLTQDTYNESVESGIMFGIIKIINGNIVISNRLIEMVLTYHYISEEKIKNFHQDDLNDRSQFIKSGKLDMEFILKRYSLHFNQIFGEKDEIFLEQNGRLLFMTYLRPIINGIGHFHIESQTPDGKRVDLIVDCLEYQYLIELNIFYGDSYIVKSEDTIIKYLNAFDLDTGYLLIYNLNKNKKTGITKYEIQNKTIIQAIV